MADDKNSKKALENQRNELEAQRDIQVQMEKSASAYLGTIKKIGDLRRSIAATEKQITKEKEKQKNLKGTELEISKKLTADLEQQLETQKKQAEEISKAASGAGALKTIVKSSAGLAYKWGFQNLRGWGVFEMDKEIRNATRSMALGSKGFYNLTNNLGKAADSTTMMGVNLKSLAKMQQGYSEAIGRSVMLTESGNKAMAELAEGTGLGEGFAVEMASAMDNFGASVEVSRDLVEETMNIAAEMGVNGAAATKALQSALQKSQRFVFKGGVKALAKMANEATRLKLDMDGIAGVAEKVFRPEGAIELAAQLQTMGGEFAKLADPMKLMFKARNDFEGFAKDIGGATKEFLKFNQETGTFELKGGLAADRMREISNLTGISVEKLQEMGEAQLKLDKIGSLVPISFGKEETDFIATIAQFEKGKGFTVSGIEGIEDGKLVSELSSSERELVLDEMENRKATLEKRAKLNQTFTDTLENFMDTLKQLFIPFAQGLQEALGGPLIDFTKKAEEEGWFDSIRDFGKKIVEVAKGIGKFLNGMVETFGAGGTLAGLLVGGGAAWAFGAGASLGAGFLSVVGASKLMGSLFGGGGGGVPPVSGGSGKFGKFGSTKGGMSFGKSAMKGLKTGGLLGIGSMALDYGRNFTEEGSATDTVLSVGSKAAEYGAYGAMLGSIVPGIGNAAGAIAGGILGGGVGLYNSLVGLDDGIVKFNPKDKFIGIGNDTLVAGTDAGGNRALANQIAGNTTSKSEVTHKHEPMKVIFEFIGLSENTARELLNNGRFIKDMNLKLNEVSSGVFSGGKLSPNPKFS